MKKSLIIGGLGFIGCHLTEECLAKNHEVTIITRSLKKQKNIAEFQDKVTLVQKDLKDIGESVRGFDYIFNLAGTTHNYSIIEGKPHLDIESNCNNTIALLEAIKDFNPSTRLVFASTFFVNGKPQNLPVTPETPCNPLGLYGATRLAGENFCHIYNNTFGLDSIVLRFCNVFGPREEGNKQKAGFNYLIKNAVEGNELSIYLGGDFYRDYIFVTDVASACMTAAEKGQTDKTYYVGRGEYTKFRNLIDTIVKETGVKTKSISPPDFHKRVGILDFVCDPTPLKKLGWAPQVSLEDGIKRTIAYYRGLK